MEKQSKSYGLLFSLFPLPLLHFPLPLNALPRKLSLYMQPKLVRLILTGCLVEFWRESVD